MPDLALPRDTTLVALPQIAAEQSVAAGWCQTTLGFGATTRIRWTDRRS
jgi:hypothetical protein